MSNDNKQTPEMINPFRPAKEAERKRRVFLKRQKGTVLAKVLGLVVSAKEQSGSELLPGSDDAPKMEVLCVKLSGGYAILVDGTIREEYEPPHYATKAWTVIGKEIRHPYLYRDGKPVLVEEVRILVSRPWKKENAGKKMGVSGLCYSPTKEPWKFPETAADRMPAVNKYGTPIRNKDGEQLEMLVAVNLTSDNKFKKFTYYSKEYKIQWSAREPDGLPADAGTSESPVYVCIAEPKGQRWRTVVHLACSNSGAHDEETARENSWALFKAAGNEKGPRNVNGWDEKAGDFVRPLYYYKAGIPWANKFASCKELLENGNGQCLAWVDILRRAWAINRADGKSAYWFKVRSNEKHVSGNEFLPNPVNHFTFFVKNWALPPNPPVGSMPETVSITLGFGADGWQTTGTAQITNNAGAPGQNSPTPCEKIFTNHAVISMAHQRYVDPSYGLEYVDEHEFVAKCVYALLLEAPKNATTPSTIWILDDRGLGRVFEVGATPTRETADMPVID